MDGTIPRRQCPHQCRPCPSAITSSAASTTAKAIRTLTTASGWLVGSPRQSDLAATFASTVPSIISAAAAAISKPARAPVAACTFATATASGIAA
eukprot:44936-Prymnesium_polylepis.1